MRIAAIALRHSGSAIRKYRKVRKDTALGAMRKIREFGNLPRPQRQLTTYNRICDTRAPSMSKFGSFTSTVVHSSAKSNLEPIQH